MPTDTGAPLNLKKYSDGEKGWGAGMDENLDTINSAIQQLQDSPGGVTSVAGKTGDVSLVEGDIANLTTDLAAKAPLASPVLTGTPTAPTPTVGDNSTKIATTAFVAQNAPPAPVTSVAGKTGAVTLNENDISSLVGDLAAKAPIASPALTGAPTAPTAAPGNNSTRLSTTAYVDAAIAALINGSPGALDTLKELADALGDDASFATTMTNALALKAPLASPVLTGNPTAPTPAVDDNDTSIATTAFVLGQGSGSGDGTPAMDGTAARGSATHFARADHVHPTDTSRAPLASPALTGAPTAPTQSPLDNSTKLATTAYDDAAVLVEKTRALAAEALLAPLASPALTGAPTAPTPALGDNSTNIATSAFAQSLVASLLAPQLVQSGLLAQYNMTDSGGANGYTLTDSSSNANHGKLGDQAPITNLSLTTNVVTITAANDYSTGQIVALSGLTTNPGLNGTSLTILASGLSSSQFKANLTHADIPSAAETGFAVVTATVPSFLAGTGGMQFTAANKTMASLPAALNAMKTMMLVTFFDPGASNNKYGCPISPNTGNIGPAVMYTYDQANASIAGQNYFHAQGWTAGGGFGSRSIAPCNGYIILTVSQQVGGDHFYYYTKDYGAGTTIGSLGSGNHQLGGGHGNANPTWFQGQILFAAFWNVALTTAQITQNVQAVQQLLTNRGLVLNGTPGGGTWQTPSYVDTIVLDGDSLTTFLLAGNFPTVTGSPNIFDNGQTGQSAETINASAVTSVDPFLPNFGGLGGTGTAGQGANRAGIIVLIGTNDSGAAASIPLGSLAAYCRKRKLAGWNKVFCVTIPSRSGADTFKNSYNALIRQNWQNWADGLLDAAAIPVFGADNSTNNTSYFSSGLHWASALAEQIIGQAYSYAIRRMYGNGLGGTPATASASIYLVQPEDIFLFADTTANNVDIYLSPAQYFTGQTMTIRNISSGGNTLTLRPKPVSATITNLSLTTNVVTITAANHYTAGDVVVLTGLTTNPSLNGSSGIVSATGLSASSFQFALTHANIASAAETGIAYLGNFCQIGAITNVAETAGNVVTLTVANNFAVGQSVKLSGITTATWLNGQTVTITSASATQIQFTDGSAHGVYASAADTGIVTLAYAAETINGGASLVVANGATCVLQSQLVASSSGVAKWLTLQNS